MAQIILDSNNNLIQGDFDNATLNNRTKLQTTTTNATTNVYVVPNGSSTSAGVSVANNSSLTNASKIVMATNGSTDTQIISGINGSGTYLPLSFYTNNTLAMQVDTSNATIFYNAGVEKMRLSDLGNLGIGVATPSTPIDLASTSSTGAISIQMTNKSTALNTTKYVGQSFRLTDSVGTGKDAAYIRCNPADQDIVNSNLIFYIRTSDINPTEKMRIDASGNLTITGATATKASGTTWANPSDIRLKDNIQDFNKGLNELLQVNVKTWEYNGKGGTAKGTKGIGVIANEIEAVLPETVDTYKAKLNAEDAEDTDIKRFDATEITWLLVKSIQEQQTIINELKTRIEALESK